jgi:hypothetical protein
LHAIRQRYHRLRTSESSLGWLASEQAQNWVADLDRKGIIKVSGLIAPEALTCLRNDFQKFIQNLENKLARGEGVYKHYDEEEHWWPNDRAYVSNNAFKYSAQLAQLCCNEALLACANLYLGKTPFIQRGIAMRYLPSRSTTNDMFGWHHDMEERRFKMMILLTDVDAGGQHMSYVLGSHKLFHPYEMFFKNECSLKYCRKHLPEINIYDAIGKAGDIFLFDSNGAHRGNRREATGVRDVFIVEYSADRSELWGGDIDQSLFDDMALRAPNPFARMMAVEKKWNLPVTRQAPTWIENLPHVDRWL